MDVDYLPEAWSCLAREVYPPLINHPCLLDPQFGLNQRPLDDPIDLPTCSDAFMDAEQGERLDSMDAHNAKRHERMLWRLVGKEDEIESDGAYDEEDMSDYTQEPTLARRKQGALRRASHLCIPRMKRAAASSDRSIPAHTQVVLVPFLMKCMPTFVTSWLRLDFCLSLGKSSAQE